MGTLRILCLTLLCLVRIHLRAGGASAAANAGVPADRLFQRHGRWNSVSAKNGYVENIL